MTRLVIYVCGRYRAPTEYGVYQNIEAARQAGANLLKNGWFPLIPHAATAYLGGIVPDSEILAGYIQLMARTCDAVYMLIGWQESEGARAEHAFAIEKGLPIVYESDTPAHLCYPPTE